MVIILYIHHDTSSSNNDTITSSSTNNQVNNDDFFYMSDVDKILGIKGPFLPILVQFGNQWIGQQLRKLKEKASASATNY